MATHEPRIVSPSPEALARAARLIREGRLVAFPTETVYGLGADATNDKAVAAIFKAKGRPRFNPLIVHFADAAAAAEAADFDGRARELARRFWPGALTLVLPRSRDSRISLLACAGLNTVAVRVPNHNVARALLAAAGVPLAAPSANPSGSVSPTTAAHVDASLGAKVALILDGGPCRIGIESTVLDLSGPEACILRPGGVPAAAIESVVGPLAKFSQAGGAPRSPGLAGRHYAPAIPLRLGATGAPKRANEALLAFGEDPPAGYAGMRNLSPSGDLTEAAANLFAMLRTLENGGFDGIAVMPVPEAGLGEAINDRLRRAVQSELAEAELAETDPAGHMERRSPHGAG